MEPLQAFQPGVGYQPALVPAVQPQATGGGGQMFAAVQREHGPGGALVEGTFLVNGHYARILFDSGATHSFIARDFMLEVGLVAERVLVPLEISTPIGRSIILDTYCRGVRVSLDGLSFVADLVVMSMSDYDVIIGMDWLARHHMSLDCFSKMVTF